MVAGVPPVREWIEAVLGLLVGSPVRRSGFRLVDLKVNSLQLLTAKCLNFEHPDTLHSPEQLLNRRARNLHKDLC